MTKRSMWQAFFVGLALLSLAASALASALSANPSNYRQLMRTLQPGDTMILAPGQYPPLAITNLNGRRDAWITITGPSSGPPALIAGEAGSNTVEIMNSSYVAIESLRINSRNIPGAFGISAKGGLQNHTHDIRIQGNVLVGQGGNQQTDGISTKIPTWGWIICNNQILQAGTGIYLGNSDGTQPFVHGLIENNLIQDTTGYDMEIKDQISIPAIAGLPIEPTSTIIRNNVFIKDDRPSPDGDRPNVLVGAFPSSGIGSLNRYEIYGNYFYHNHREALFQASGRISLHDNIFVDAPADYAAVVLRRQNFPLQLAYVYNNTIFTAGKGIYFGSAALTGDAVIGNLVFAALPISGPISRSSDNVSSPVAAADAYVADPSVELGAMDFYPHSRKCEGAPIDLGSFRGDVDYNLDFNGVRKDKPKGAIVFRGAYAGMGANPGWRLQAAIKPAEAGSTTAAAIQRPSSFSSRANRMQTDAQTTTTALATSPLAGCGSDHPGGRSRFCDANADAAGLLLWRTAAPQH